MTNLALFDLDHTLIPTDSDHEWGRFMVKLGIVDAESFSRQNDQFFADYKAGKLDIHAYLTAMLTPLAKYSRAQLAQWHEQYMHEVIRPAMTPAALELVRKHLDAGDLCCVVTATNEFITASRFAVHGPADRHAELSRRQDRADRSVARVARQAMERLHAHLLLQRLAQRHPVARESHRPDRDQP